MPPRRFPIVTAGRLDGAYRPSQARNNASASGATLSARSLALRHAFHQKSAMATKSRPAAVAEIRCTTRIPNNGSFSDRAASPTGFAP